MCVLFSLWITNIKSNFQNSTLFCHGNKMGKKSEYSGSQWCQKWLRGRVSIFSRQGKKFFFFNFTSDTFTPHLIWHTLFKYHHPSTKNVHHKANGYYPHAKRAWGIIYIFGQQKLKPIRLKNCNLQMKGCFWLENNNYPFLWNFPQLMH